MFPECEEGRSEIVRCQMLMRSQLCQCPGLCLGDLYHRKFPNSGPTNSYTSSTGGDSHSNHFIAHILSSDSIGQMRYENPHISGKNRGAPVPQYCFDKLLSSWQHKERPCFVDFMCRSHLSDIYSSFHNSLSRNLSITYTFPFESDSRVLP